MLFLQEIHDVISTQARAFEDAYRYGWMPTLGAGDDARLLWYWDQAAGSSRSHNVLTLTAVRDGAALGRLLERLESGDLQAWLLQVDELRHDVVGQILLPTEWSEINDLDFGSVPSGPEEKHEPTLYGYDTVWPPVLDDYVAYAGENWYRPLTDGSSTARIRISMPAFLQTAEGTGARPEVHLVQKRLESAEAIVKKLLGADYGAREKAPSSWIAMGLAVRDQWESRILRTTTWSPYD